MFRVDIFISRGRPFDQSQLGRRVAVSLTPDPGHTVFVASPEDVILAKLEWYGAGGQVSDRQWSDILSVLAVQSDRLDLAYLRAWADALGVSHSWNARWPIPSPERDLAQNDRAIILEHPIRKAWQLAFYGDGDKARMEGGSTNLCAVYSRVVRVRRPFPQPRTRTWSAALKPIGSNSQWNQQKAFVLKPRGIRIGLVIWSGVRYGHSIRNRVGLIPASDGLALPTPPLSQD